MKRKKGHLDGKRNKKATSNEFLFARREGCFEKGGVIRRSRCDVQVHNPKQHKEGAKEGVQKKVVGGLNFTLARPSRSDEKKHGNK